MATSLPTQNQMDFEGLALKVKDLDASGNLSVTGTITSGSTAVTSTGAEINKLDDSAVAITKGSGVSAMESYAAGAFKNGSLHLTRLVFDITGLVAAATDLDIIGNSGGTASANLGQFTTALSGTFIGGRVTCIEAPAGGNADIDFYSAVESTGAQDGGVAALTETALVTSGGSWTNGLVKGMTAVPAQGDYLYITSGSAAGGTYTAGKFMLELYGYSAAT